jgi:hypothetical protein
VTAGKKSPAKRVRCIFAWQKGFALSAPTPLRILAAMTSRRSIVTLSGLWLAAIFASRAHAADRNAEFLAALRSAGWDDTAVQFVDWVGGSPLITDEFREGIPFERAVSLAVQGRRARGAEEQARLLAQAADSFETFAKSNSESTRALDALRQSANLHAELGVLSAAEADRLTQQSVAAASETARRQSRESFARAARIAGELVKLCSERLADLPKPTVIQSNPEAKALRDLLRDRQVEAQFLIALISFEEGRTYPAGSDERGDALDEASEEFGKLVEEYRDAPVGVSSRFYQGRCAQEQGNLAKALGCFQDVASPLNASPEFRRWAARAHRCIAECLLAQGKVDDAARDAEGWLDDSRPEELKQPEWLELAFRLANVYQRQLKDSEGGDAKRLQSQIRSLLRGVAENPNEFQREARLALASLAQRVEADADYAKFADALAAGRTALDLMNSSLLAAKLARQNNPAAVSELENDAADQRDAARAAFNAAIGLADRQTPLAELNSVRFYLAWILWEEGRVEEAAVLGEFVARRYPESEFASKSASVALGSWERMYREGSAAGPGNVTSAGKSFAAKKLADMAQLIATRWPDAPEAAAAMNILIGAALREDRFEDAEALLAKIPPDKRATAEFSLGTSLWTQYLKTTAGRDVQFDEQANALRERAAKLLTSGFATYRKSGQPTTNGSVASLYLAQLLLTRGDWKAALDVLEDVDVGPLTLVQAESEATSSPQVIIETYKNSLRAYLAAQPPRREEAADVMKDLDEFIASQGGDSAAKLAQAYLGLSLQLQRQMQELTAAGKHEQAEEVAATFGDVLAHVTAGATTGDWKLLNWIGQTNLQIGQGLRDEQARPYLTRAKEAYEAILAAAKEGGAAAPDPKQALAIRRRFADVLIALGNYQEGVDQYAEVLRRDPKLLDVQQAAAEAYQSWGAAKKQQSALDKALQGAVPGADGRNIIWGWVRLASAADGAKRRAAEMAAQDLAAAQNVQRFSDLFFEARYHIAQVRYVGATFAAADARAQQLAAARQNIESMKTLYPDLGGPKWKAAFGALLKQIDEELKK